MDFDDLTSGSDNQIRYIDIKSEYGPGEETSTPQER